ncbi:uncharacterized protein LOC142174603 [Nicotiana tabacum]|uniref:Uncharacterized protein LOC142174603 n=1 Tax=Nicotiana tabacum TaxID=4097 RepID=A0AC58TH18_TOBAC
MYLPTGDLATDLFSKQVKEISKEDSELYVLTSESIIQAIGGASTTTNSNSVPRSLNVNTNEYTRINVSLWYMRLGHVTLDILKKNGVAERRHKHILNVARTLRFQASIPLRLRGECVIIAIYLRNRLSASILKGKAPYEVLHGALSSLTHLRVFGCLGYVLEVRRTDKFAPRVVPAVFIGQRLQHYRRTRLGALLTCQLVKFPLDANGFSRLVIVVAAAKHWHIIQMDVHNAFLQGDLLEEVYIDMARGFSTQGGSYKVCRLHKSLYGLKHAPRQRNKKLIDALLQLGFTQSHFDYSLFTKKV